MALTYRSPIEDIVGSFDTSHQTAIATTAATSYKELEADNFQYFNYALSPEGKKQLINAGIYLSPYSAVPHSHPCCKTLENYILYKVLPSYIDNSFFFVGIKNFKLSILKKREKHLDMVKAINRYVTSADRLRYTSDFVVRASKAHKALERHGTAINSAPLRDLVPELMRYSARKLFLHDELHYWSPQDLGSFLDAVEPETVLCTLVYPPELLVGSPSSLNPWCYKYDCDGELLRFYPDGVLTEGYEQPVSGGFLLRSNTFTTLRGEVYCVDVLCSKFAHHLVALTKGPAITVTQRSFGPFQATDMQGLSTLTPRYRTFYPIQVEVVSRMYRYLRSLKKPDPQSAMAKLSQIVSEPTGAEIKFVQEFCEIVLQCNPISTMIAPDHMKTFAGNVLGCLPSVLAQRFKSVKEVCLDTFVGELKPFVAKIKLGNTNALSHFEVAMLHEVGTSYDPNIITDMERKFTGVPIIPDRSACKYAGIPKSQEHSTSRGTMYEHASNGEKIAYALQKIVMQSHLNKEQGKCDAGALRTKLEFMCRTSGIAKSMLIAMDTRYSVSANIGQIVSAVMKRARLHLVLYPDAGVKWFNHPRRGHLKLLTRYSEGTREAKWEPTFGALIAQRNQSRKWSKVFQFEQEHNGTKNADIQMLTNYCNEQGAEGSTSALVTNEIVETSSEHMGSTSDDFGVTVEFPAEDQSDDGSVTMEFSGGTYTRGMEMPIMAYVTKNVPADGDCFWHCVCDALEMNPGEVRRICKSVDLGSQSMNARLQEQLVEGQWAEDESIMACAKQLHLQIEIYEPDSGFKHVCKSHQSTQIIMLMLKHEHFQILLPKNGCMLHATAKALGRSLGEVLKVIHENVDEELVLEIWEGEGLNHLHLETVFKLFDIQAHVDEEGRPTLYNEEGRLKRDFRMYDGHIEFTRKQGLASTGLLNKATYSRTINAKALEIMNRAGTLLKYNCELTRAKNLADSLYEGSTGVISSKLFNNKVHLLENVQTQAAPVIPCTVILGTFGAGKSTLFKNFMKVNLGKCVTYVSPRKALAASFKMEVFKGKKPKAGQEHWRVCTFEKFLMQAKSLLTGQAVVIDEVQLYPPGYLDLIGLLMPSGVHCFLVGDPCQSDYDSEQDRGRFLGLESDVHRLLKAQRYKFVVGSRRFNNGNYKNRLPCALMNLSAYEREEQYELREGVDVLGTLEKKWLEVVLVSSFDEKKIVSAYTPAKTVCMTFGESTGLNFKYGTILITRSSEFASEKRWITALSRFSENVCIINACGFGIDALLLTYKRRCLGRFLTATASTKDLHEHLPGQPEFVSTFTEQIGKDEGLREEKLAGDPWLKTMINLGQTEDSQEVEEAVEIAQEVNFKTHLPQCELEGLRARWVHRILSKEVREVRMGHMVSEQFTDSYPKQEGVILTNAAERFETIYPRHRASDSVTFIMAVKKRLRFSKPMIERAKLQQAENYGSYLRDIFLKHVPLRKQHNHKMMEDALNEFEEKKCSKSAATIENHSNRSCRDWLLDIAMIFSKSQLCTKFDNRFRVAKAAQSIVCFQHAVLCRFAPYMRYIEKKLHEAMPRKFYVHSGKGLEELNDWVKEGMFDGVCTESDYEAFDASQDQYIVAFELAIMRHLGLPNDLIEDYKFIKTHLGSKLGSFAIMRFSGEASTFLFNTMANMLFTFMRYSLRGNEYICFAGDDMCSSKRLVTTEAHSKFLGKLKLKAKVFHVTTPTFCGWNLSPHGIYKKPQLVLERMCIARELNNLPNCIDNYAIEVGFAYRLGELALSRMDEEEVEAFYNCVRIIIKNKHHLKSNIADLFKEID